LRVYWRLHLEQ